MSVPSIRVSHLAKRYRLGERQPHRRLTEALSRAAKRPISVRRRRPREYKWALDDVSFEVAPGDVVGIIGKNGAGKSTLLKILSRITEPTNGTVELRGRVGSLLEVGTGFHPELTGRDNVFLNGAILGMTRSEITRKFDEIVAFAEIDEYIDTPLKRYSTGMGVRLAFSIAAHLEPEILLVDEVLAVGDATFQQRSLGKMDAVAKQGRTVLFVSHNLPALQRLCSIAHLLDEGRLLASGPAHEVVEQYYGLFSDRTTDLEARVTPPGTVRFVDWALLGTDEPHSVQSNGRCHIEMTLIARRRMPAANFGLAIWSEDGTLVWAMRSLDFGGTPIDLKEGDYRLEFSLQHLPLRPGSYQILVSANDHHEGTLDEWYAQPKLKVLAWDEPGLPSQWQGLLNLRGEFRIVPDHPRTRPA